MEAYVSFEVAKLLKEKGFDWSCISYWCEFPNGDIVHTDVGASANHNGQETNRFTSRPTQQMACRWLREEKGIHIVPDRVKNVVDDNHPFYDYYCIIRDNNDEQYIVDSIDLPPGQYYLACEDAINAALLFVLKNLI